MNKGIWQEKGAVVITCAKGMSSYLMQELKEAGYPVSAAFDAAVEVQGSLEDAMALNLRVRTGQRVLFLLEEFNADSASDFYRRLYRLPWEKWIANDGYLCVTSATDTPAIRDSRYANVKAKDAIVDRIRDRTGIRPDSGSERRGAVVHIYWKNDRVRLYLDTSGEPLSKRGYRRIPLQAPMQETLAAGVVLATGWRGEGPFVNPMCGSGTLAIEAVLIALNRAPGLLRDNFGFMHLKGYDPDVWKAARLRAKALERREISPPVVIASDISAEAIRASRQNAQTAGVDHCIAFRRCSFEKTPIPPGERGVVVLNPGYGERLGKEEELAVVYGGIGDFFKQQCQGYRGFVFTGNFSLAKKIGLRASRRVPFYNGELECRLLTYDMYAGSRKKTLCNNGAGDES